MKTSILIIMCFFTTISLAQTIIEGIVFDDKQHPVAYATIGLYGSNQTTLTNENGKFKLTVTKLPSEVKVSAIGFESLQLEVNSLNMVIFLRPVSYKINEVTIHGNNASQFFFKAYKKILKPNYKSYQGDLFYRLVSQNDSVYTELMEGFYKVDVGPTGFNDWQLKHGRYAIKQDYKEHQNIVSIDLSALVRYVDLTNDHRSGVNFPLFPFQPNCKNLYNFFSRGVSFINGKELRKIEFIPKNITSEAFSGVAYIEEESSNLHRLETFYKSPKSNLISSQFGKYPAYDLTIKYTIDFTENFEHKMLLSFIDIDLSYLYAHLTNPKQVKTHIQSYIYDKKTPTVKSIVKTQSTVQLSDHAIIRNRLYIKPFWDDNTILIQTGLEQLITQNFEQKGYFGQAYGNSADTNSILKEGFAILNKKVNHLIMSIQEKPLEIRDPNCIVLTLSEKPAAALCSQLFVSHNCYKDSFYILVLPLIDTSQSWVADSVKLDDSFSFIFSLYSKISIIHAQMLLKKIIQIANPCENDILIDQVVLKANEELSSTQSELFNDCWKNGDLKFWEHYLSQLEKEN